MKDWFEIRFLEESGQIRMQARWEAMGDEWMEVGSLIPTREAAACLFGLLVRVAGSRYAHDSRVRPYRFTLRAGAEMWPLRIRVLCVRDQKLVQVVCGLGGIHTLGEQRFATVEEAETTSDVLTAAVTAITGFGRAPTTVSRVPRVGEVRGRTLSAPPPPSAAQDDPGITLTLDE